VEERRFQRRLKLPTIQRNFSPSRVSQAPAEPWTLHDDREGHDFSRAEKYRQIIPASAAEGPARIKRPGCHQFPWEGSVRRPAQPFLILTIEVAPSLSRPLRQGGVFDFPKDFRMQPSQIPHPVPAKSAGTRTGQPHFLFAAKGWPSPPESLPEARGGAGAFARPLLTLIFDFALDREGHDFSREKYREMLRLQPPRECLSLLRIVISNRAPAR
jgi:hypothetical protein